MGNTLLDDLTFLGQDKDSSIEGQRIEQENLLTGGQGDLLQQMNRFLSGQIGQGVTAFQGIRPGEVGFSGLQNQGFGLAGGFGQGIRQGQRAFGNFDPNQGQGFLDQAQGFLGQGQGFLDKGQGFLGQGQNFLRQGQGFLDQAGQDFDPQTILDALEPGRQLAENQFNQRTVPDLLERFGANSGSSGALNQAFADAGSNLSLGLGAQAAPFLGQAALQAPGNQLRAAQLAGDFARTSGGFAGQLGNFAGQAGGFAGQAGGFAGIPGQLAQQGFDLSSQGLGQLFGAGALQRSLGQGQAGANQSRFLESQAQNNPFLSQLGGLALGTNAFENIAFQGFRDPSDLEKTAPIMGGAMSAIGGMMSDERVKDKIETIDNALDKIEELDGKTYHYIFKPESEKDAGLIAQDIEKVLPEAVTEVRGVKMVKYEAIIGLLVNANKELHDRVKQLERKVA